MGTSIRETGYVIAGTFRTYTNTPLDILASIYQNPIENIGAYQSFGALQPLPGNTSWLPLRSTPPRQFIPTKKVYFDFIYPVGSVSSNGNTPIDHTLEPSYVIEVIETLVGDPVPTLTRHDTLPSIVVDIFGDGMFFRNNYTFVNFEVDYAKGRGSYISEWIAGDSAACGTGAAGENQNPYYYDLVTGYYLDARTKPPDNPIVTPVTTESIRIGYYRRNPLEGLPLTSIDWLEYPIKLIKDKPVKLPIVDPVLGTLHILEGSGQVIGLLPGTQPSNYSYLDYLPGAIPRLFSDWQDLYDNAPPLPVPVSSCPAGFIATKIETTTTAVVSTELKCSTANNNHWLNQPQVFADIGFDANHEFFKVDEQRAYEWHIAPQSEGIGTLMVDSIRTIETHAALDAGRYATDGNGNPRIASLGHLIERIAAMLGYRPEPDGTIDQEKERTIYNRKLIKPGASLPKGKYMAGRFGFLGMLLRRLPNRRKGNKWEAGGIVAIHDIPQLLTEILDQLNQALNIQDSTSIQIRDGADTYEYPNQLALLSEIATGAIQQRRQVREIWASSIVCQQSINEVIAGIGLPAVSKSIVINNQRIPYWGIQPDKSLQREIATVAYNVGVATGQLL